MTSRVSQRNVPQRRKVSHHYSTPTDRKSVARKAPLLVIDENCGSQLGPCTRQRTVDVRLPRCARRSRRDRDERPLNQPLVTRYVAPVVTGACAGTTRLRRDMC